MKAIPKQQSLDTWIFLATTATISNPCQYLNKSRIGKAQSSHLDKKYETDASKQIPCNKHSQYTICTVSLKVKFSIARLVTSPKNSAQTLTDSEK
jgi:hypothetical protein